ncbi:hypothetical protein SAMN05216524_103575 [Mucilaginibacter sp. OK098]|nr:hypothetical protein SAMN05216524_103575 [Mucilaginibacter sp. OK098]
MDNIIKPKNLLPSLRAAKGGRSSEAMTGWVNVRAILTQMHGGLTHPDYAITLLLKISS